MFQITLSKIGRRRPATIRRRSNKSHAHSTGQQHERDPEDTHPVAGECPGEQGEQPGGQEQRDHPQPAPFTDRVAGALIARIGSASPIFLGADGEVRATTSGRLYFSVNDDYLMDNSGDYRVTLTLRR